MRFNLHIASSSRRTCVPKVRRIGWLLSGGRRLRGVVIGVMTGLGAERAGVPRHSWVDRVGLGAVAIERGGAGTSGDPNTPAPRTGLPRRKRSNYRANEGLTGEWVAYDCAHLAPHAADT
jgi:hypothetical protein